MDEEGSKSVRGYLVVFHTTEEETVIIHTLQRHCPNIQTKCFQHFLSESVVAMGTEVTPESWMTSESLVTSSNKQDLVESVTRSAEEEYRRKKSWLDVLPLMHLEDIRTES